MPPRAILIASPVTDWPAVIATVVPGPRPGRRAPWKPARYAAFVALTLYCPGGSHAIVKRPSSSVVAMRSLRSSGLRTETRAFRSGAFEPSSSTITPEMDPVPGFSTLSRSRCGGAHRRLIVGHERTVSDV